MNHFYSTDLAVKNGQSAAKIGKSDGTKLDAICRTEVDIKSSSNELACFKEEPKVEIIEQDNNFSVGSVKLENRDKSRFETVSVKNYISNFVKEEPLEDILTMFKETPVVFEKQDFHRQVFKEILHENNINVNAIGHLEDKYISQLREVAKIEIFKCQKSSCEYETMHHHNIQLHLILFHKSEMEHKMLKCLNCTYYTKSKKCMEKHVISHEESEVENNFSDYHADTLSSDDSEPLIKKIKRVPKITRRLRKNSIKLYRKPKKKVRGLTNNRCDLCPYESEDKIELRDHKLSHMCPEQKKFKCYKCEYEVVYKLKLQRHLLKVHHIITKGSNKIKSFKCGLCDYETDLQSSLELHSVKHKKPEEIEWFHCDRCQFKTKFKKSLAEHTSRKHMKPDEIVKSIMCEICSYKCRRKSDLKKHLISHKTLEDAEEIFTCPYCEHKTKSKQNLRVHILVHKDPSEVKMYKCDSCDFQSKRKFNLDMHKLHHKTTDETEVFKCTVCAYQTKFKDRLKRHLKKGQHAGRNIKHKSPSQLLKCPICEFETMSRKHYCQHVVGHRSQGEMIEKTYVCDVCGFKTFYSNSFMTHMKTHKTMEEVETFQCTECNFKTKFKGNLQKHMNIHKDPSELTMYKCDICGIQLTRKENLNVHMLLHKSPDETEVVKCSLCSYQSKIRAYMQVHLKKTHKIITRRNEYREYCTIVNPSQNHVQSNNHVM